MRKLLYATIVTAAFPLNALADDMQRGHTAPVALTQGQAVADVAPLAPPAGFGSQSLALPQKKPMPSKPVDGFDWSAFEKVHSRLESDGVADRQGEPRAYGSTNLAQNSPDGDQQLHAYKGEEAREVKIGTIGTPEKHQTVADFKLSGPNAVEVTFSFFF